MSLHRSLRSFQKSKTAWEKVAGRISSRVSVRIHNPIWIIQAIFSFSAMRKEACHKILNHKTIQNGDYSWVPWRHSLQHAVRPIGSVELLHLVSCYSDFTGWDESNLGDITIIKTHTHTAFSLFTASSSVVLLFLSFIHIHTLATLYNFNIITWMGHWQIKLQKGVFFFSNICSILM